MLSYLGYLTVFFRFYFDTDSETIIGNTAHWLLMGLRGFIVQSAGQNSPADDYVG